MPGSDTSGSYERIYSVVSRIPRGRVATYGQVARLAGLPGQARLVGYALSAIDGGSRIPWHRVVNAQGQICARRDGSPASIVQRLRLERGTQIALTGTSGNAAGIPVAEAHLHFEIRTHREARSGVGGSGRSR